MEFQDETTVTAAATRPGRAMTELVYEVSFNTPAFLGNAEQQGQWRTPPFKSLLRHWWRVAAVANDAGATDVKALREREAALFGAAGSEGADEKRGAARKASPGRSKVSLRFDHWEAGTLDPKKWPRKEFGRERADVYLGFGPVQAASTRDAINTYQSNHLHLTIRCADSTPDFDALNDGLQLAAWFGTMGSRARNGWGSLSLKGAPEAPMLHAVPTLELLQPWLRPLRQCLQADWATAIGSDEHDPLVWFGPTFQDKDDWRACVNFLAKVRKQVRLCAADYGACGLLSASHVVGFPVTNSPSRWGQEDRIPNGIRFKVVRSELGLVPVVAHLPVRVPEAYRAKLLPPERKWLQDNELKIWTQVHARLDQFAMPLGKLTRIGR